MSIYPNPSNQYLIVEYQLECENSNNFIDILDATSVKIYELQLHSSHSQVVIPVNNLKTSLYLVRLIVDNQVIESKKVTVL